MTRAEEYRIEFNKLESVLKKKANVHDEKSISSVLTFLVNKQDRVIQQFEDQIRQYITLRNAIIHQSTDKAIAEPYEETIVALRRLVEYVEHPKTARDIATKNLIKASPSDKLSSVIKQMSKGQITSLPIVEDKKVIGFVSESSVVKIVDFAFEEDSSAALINESVISDIEFDQPYGNESDIYAYATGLETVYDIEDMFNEAIRNGKRLLAVLVSSSGSPSSTPLGIITAWDLYKIDW